MLVRLRLVRLERPWLRRAMRGCLLSLMVGLLTGWYMLRRLVLKLSVLWLSRLKLLSGSVGNLWTETGAHERELWLPS